MCENANTTCSNNTNLVDISQCSPSIVDMELEKGYSDIILGKTTDAEKAFTNIRQDYGI